MKTRKVMLSTMAFTFAVMGAFASKLSSPESVDSLWRKNASNPTQCESQDECTLDSGQACSFQVYSNDACSTAITKRRP